MSSSPTDLTVRPPRPDDAEAVNAVVAGHEAAFADAVTSTPEDLLHDWESIDLERDAWVWEESGRILAYGALYTPAGHFDADGYVHPNAWNRGLGTAIAQKTEGRARERGATSIVNSVLARDARACALLERRGYRDARHFYRMQMALDAPPPEPEWPAGVTVSTLDPGEAEEFHAALEDAFSDEWGHAHEPFEAFARRRIERDGFDPTLWWVVRGGGEIAAVLIADWKRHGDAGWIASVGVREAWRRRGLGAALLRQAIGELYRRGERTVGLGVDAANPTGATRLYERIGMHVVFEAIAYEKALG